MRIEISAGGIGYGTSVMEFSSVFDGFLSNTDSVISCFKTIKNETYSLSGGAGNLQTALDNLESRVRTEEALKESAVLAKAKSDSFLSLAQRIDNQVASDVKKNRNEFYSVNSWAKPTTSNEEKKWYEKAWNWLCKTDKVIAGVLLAPWVIANDLAHKLWSSAVEYYKEHKKIINTVLIVLGAVAAIAAVFFTGGVALAALVPLLTAILPAIGIPAGAASVISAVIGVGAILSTIASSSMNIYDVWNEVDDPTFNSWQKGLNIASFFFNITYSIGGIYNSVKKYKLFSRVDWSSYPEGAPKPKGFYRILEGEEYDTARKLANSVNNGLHRSNPSLAGLDIHEIHPVKFGGSPSDTMNKLFLTRKEHNEFSAFWRMLQNAHK